MKKRLLALAIVAVLAISLIAACGPADEPAPVVVDTPEDPVVEAPPEPEEEEERPEEIIADARTHLRIGTASLPASLCPQGQNDNPSAQAWKQIYSRLIDLDYDTFEPVPGLAHSWEVIDARSVRFFLRDDVVFHNGQPLTAQDVQYSIERVAVAPPFEPIFGMFTHVDIEDDYTVVIHSEMDFAPFLRHIAHSGGAIVPYGMTEEELREHPIGTGPFMFESITPGDRLELVRFDDYWGSAPLLERMTFIEITDPPARALAIQAGDVDLVLGIMPPDMAPLEADPNVNVIRRMSLGTDYIGFNNTIAPWNDVRVRQAVNYAFNAQAVVDAVFMGQGAPQAGPIPAIAFGAADLEPFPYDVERARELMAEAGLEDGFEATAWFNLGNAARSDVMEALQAALRAINIELTVEGVEWADYLERTANFEHDLFILGWVTVTGDADYGLFPLFHTSVMGPGGNRSGFSNADVDRLLEEGRSELDPARRIEIYAEIQQIIRDEAAWVFLRQGENVDAAVPSLRGFVSHPAAHHAFYNIWFDE